MSPEFEQVVSAHGVPLIRRYQYASADEWRLMYSLAKESGLSLRQLQMNLLLDYRDQLRQDLKSRLRDLN